MAGLTALDPSARTIIVQGVANGLPLDTVADLAGIGHRTLMEWLKIANDNSPSWSNGYPVSDQSRADISRLSLEIQRARAEFEAKALKAIAERGENDGKGRSDWRSPAWVLEHHPLYKHRWAPFREVQVEQHHTVSQARSEVRALPVAEQDALLPAEFRELLDDEPDPAA